MLFCLLQYPRMASSVFNFAPDLCDDEFRIAEKINGSICKGQFFPFSLALGYF